VACSAVLPVYEIPTAATRPFDQGCAAIQSTTNRKSRVSHGENSAPRVPKDRVVVAESGLGSPADLARMARVGAKAFLIGESFMRKPDVEAAVREILVKQAA